MSRQLLRENLLSISRLLSEAEDLARPVSTGQGIRDAIHLAQLAVARQLARAEMPPPPPERDRHPDPTAVLARYQAHLGSAAHGGQARLARQAGLAETTLSKFRRTGHLGNAQLARLAAALDAADLEGPPR